MTTERRKSIEEHHNMASHHNSVLFDKGPPALYHLNTERKYIDGTNKKVRQWIYGQRDRNKQNKVILMVGETGAGKTTIINTMINYSLGVKFEDQEFYQITEETKPKDQSQSQTSEITVYEVFVEESPTSLTIIDTPGYGNTEEHEKDREISEYLIRLFSDEDGIHYIDAVCFVMKASQNRLTDKEFYIFHSVLSLFGRDIEENIVFLLTHSDGGPPTDALNAIKTAEIPCRRDERKKPVHFLFNNQQKEERDEEYEHLYRSSWGMGEKSINQFFTLLDEKNRKSVVMTLDVLNERRRLEACVNNLKEQIGEKELKTEELNQIQETLRQNRDKIKKCENFQFTVKTAVKEKVSTENEWRWNRNATCCSDCEQNCHEHCSDEEPSKCSVMKNNQCTVCTGKCHYSKHVRENKKYVTKTKTITLTFVDLKQEDEHTGEKPKTSFQKDIFENITKERERNMTESENKTKIEGKVKSDLEKIKNEKSNLLNEAYKIIMILSKITLKSDSAFTLQHLDFLIPRLKEEGKDEWMKSLEDLRKAGEERKNKGALRHVMELAAVASSTHHRRRKSLDEPPEIIARVSRLRDEFIELYERDHLELQQCTERLHSVIEEFEEDYRRSTEDSRHAGRLGISGGAALVAGIVAAPANPAYLLVTRVPALRAARFFSGISSSNKMQQMTKLRQDIEAELKKFQDKIKPMIEKMNEIKHTEKILKEQDVIQIEDVVELTAQISANMHSTASLEADFGRFNFVLAMISVFKNTSVLKDMNKLAETPIDEEIDESGMTSKAGKFIVEMKKFIHQLQNITVKLQKAKDKIVIY